MPSEDQQRLVDELRYLLRWHRHDDVTSRKLTPYGSMYVNNGSQSVTIAGVDTYVQVGGGMSAGLTSGFIFQNSKELKTGELGMYLITWSMSVQCATAVQEVEGTIMVDGTANVTVTSHAELVSANKPQVLSGSGIVSLGANALVSLAVANHTGANNLIVPHASISVIRIA